MITFKLTQDFILYSITVFWVWLALWVWVTTTIASKLNNTNRLNIK